MNHNDIIELCSQLRICCEDLLIAGLAFMNFNDNNSKITDICYKSIDSKWSNYFPIKKVIDKNFINDMMCCVNINKKSEFKN